MAATLPAPPFFARAERLSKSPIVCQALFSRSFDNDDLLPRIRKPMPIMPRAHDAVVKLAAVES
jgi:non-heme chloroperoxidase